MYLASGVALTQNACSYMYMYSVQIAMGAPLTPLCSFLYFYFIILKYQRDRCIDSSDSTISLVDSMTYN